MKRIYIAYNKIYMNSNMYYKNILLKLVYETTKMYIQVTCLAHMYILVTKYYSL